MTDNWIQTFRLERSGSKLRINSPRISNVVIDLREVRFMDIRYDQDGLYYIHTNMRAISGLSLVQAEMIFKEYQDAL